MAALIRLSRFLTVNHQFPKIIACSAHTCSSKTRHLQERKYMDNGCRFISSFQTSRFDRTSRFDLPSDQEPRTARRRPQLGPQNFSEFGEILYRLEANLHIDQYAIISRTIYTLFDKLKQEEKLTSKQCVIIIRSLGSMLCDLTPQQRSDLVDRFCEKAKELGVTFDIQFYNALLSTHLQNGKKFSPTEFLATLMAENIQPNRVTYQRLIAAYCEDGDMESAKQLMEQMKSLDMPISDSVFNSLITGYFILGDKEKAEGILEIMNQTSILPGADTYKAILNGHARKGDMDAILEFINRAKSENVLVPDVLLDTIITLERNGHHPHTNQVIACLSELPLEKYNLSVSICQLLAGGFDETAQKIISLNQINSFMKGFYDHAFLRMLIASDASVDRIMEFNKTLSEPKQLEELAILSFYCKNPDCGRGFLKKMYLEGIPVKEHYYWPAICEYREKNNLNGIKESIKDAVTFCDNTDHVLETIEEYVIPALIAVDPDIDLEAAFQDAGLSDQHYTKGLVLYHLYRGNFSKANEVVERVPNVLNVFLMRSRLAAYAKSSGKFDEVFEFLGSLSPHFGFMKYQITFITGELLVKAVYASTKKIESIINILESYNLNILSKHAEMLEKPLEGVSASVLERLNALVVSERKSREVDHGSYRYSMENPMNQQELEDLLSLKPNHKYVLVDLLNLYAGNDDAEAVKRTQAKIDDLDVKYNAWQLRQIALINAGYLEHLDTALKYHQKLEETGVDMPHVRLTYMLAKLMVKENDWAGAIQTLNKYADRRLVFDEIDTDSHIQQSRSILKMAVQTQDEETVQQLIKALDRIEELASTGINFANEVKMEVLIEGDKFDEAMEMMEESINKDRRTYCLEKFMKALINNSDAQRLQKVIDLASTVYGSSSMLTHLMMQLIDCGHLEKAQKVLKVPDFAISRKTVYSQCEELANFKQVETLKKVVDFFKRLGLDKEELFFQLMRGYCTAHEYNKAKDVLTILEDENVPPRDRTLRYLSNVFKRQEIEYDFIVPEYSTEDKVNIQQDRRAQRSVSKATLPIPITETDLRQNFIGELDLEQVDNVMAHLEKNSIGIGQYLHFDGLLYLKEHSPQTIDKLQEIVSKIQPIQPHHAYKLWNYYFYTDSPQADILVKNCPQLFEMRTGLLYLCKQLAKDKNEEKLRRLIEIYKGKNEVVVYCELINIHCDNGDCDKAIAVVQEINPDLYKFRNTRGAVAKVEELLTRNDRSIPWDIKTDSDEKTETLEAV